MSFTDDYLEAKKKKKKEKTTAAKTGHSFTDEYLSKVKPRAEEDIAPVLSKVATKVQSNEANDDGKKLDFFQKGAFEDGYQLGDITKTILGTAGDLTTGVVKGASKLVGGVIDAGTYGVAGIADAVGKDDFADRMRVKARENVIDNAFKKTDDYLNKYSVLGKTSDAVAEGLGQVGAIILTGGIAGAAGLGAAGVTAATTGVMGISSLGSGMSEAYEGGATDEEAATYGLIKGVVDAGSEMIFGGLGKTVKALGVSRGLSSLDDVFARKLSSKIANQTAKNLSEYGIKSGFEGVEEIFAGLGSAVGKKLTYMDDEELSALIRDENLLEQFVVGTVASGIAQSGVVPGMKSGSLREANQTGRDFISGMSENEQKVIDKEYENRVAAQEKDGNKLSEQEKSKIYDAVVSDMEKGYISTDTIEEVLGGDTFKSYRETVDSEDAIAKEFEELGKKQNATLAEQSRYNDLKQKMDEIKQNSQRNTLKSQLSEEVMGLVQNDRLAESYNERARRGQAYEADLTKYNEKQQAVIQKAVDSGILNNTRRTHEFVDMIAKISADKGVLFDFTNNEKLKGTSFAVEGKTVNGFVTKDGVTLNIDSAKSLNSVVGHEITHVLEGTDLYAELQTAVMEYAKTKKDYRDRVKSTKDLYKDIEGADVSAEMTADLIGDYLFTDPDFINNLSTNHRNVFQKIYDEIKYLCKVATAGSKEARELEKVKRAFEKAYKEGGKKTDTKYSVSDSNGKQLTKEQQEYFKDSKARDENGNLQLVYHGTRKADFTVFNRTANYYTDSKETADSYAPSSEMYEGYVNLTKPFIIDAHGDRWSGIAVDNDLKKLLENYGSSTFKERGKWRTSSDDIVAAILDMVEEGEADYDGVIIRNVDDTGSYFKGEGGAIGTDYITFSSNQFKNADNLNPTSDPDIRFSLSKPVEETKDLMALHNLHAAELVETLKLSGLPSPSVAIIKAKAGHDKYGDVSLILPKDAIDPQANKANRIYGSDAWTPTRSNAQVEYEVDYDTQRQFERTVEQLAKSVANGIFSKSSVLGMAGIEGSTGLNLNEIAKKISSYDAVQAAYVAENGGDVEVVYRTKEFDTYGNDALNGYIEKVGEQEVASLAAKMLTGDRLTAEEIETAKDAIVDSWATKKAYALNRKPELREIRIAKFRDNLTHLRTEDFVRHAWEFYEDSGATTDEIDRGATGNNLSDAVNRSDVEAWVAEKLQGLLGEPSIYNGLDPYTPSGKRRSFKEMHWDYTAENIVRAMNNADARGANMWNVSGEAVIATATPEYKNIDEVRADKDRLYKADDDYYEQIKDDISAELQTITSNIIRSTEHHSNNQYDEEQIIGRVIMEAAQGTKTVAGVKQVFRKNGYSIGDAQAKSVLALFDRASSVPTGYFEAKPQRVVGFDEVGVYVIPNNADVKLKQELLNRGYSIAEYDPNVEGDRTKVLNQFEEYKFSLSDARKKTYGNYNVYGKDIALEPVSETESVQETAPAPEIAPVKEDAPVNENAAPTMDDIPIDSEEGQQTFPYVNKVLKETAAENATIEHSVSDLADIAKQGRRENMRGAYNHNGKQYLSDGSFIAEFDTVDESLDQSKDFPIKQAVKELDEAFERKVEGNYDLHTSDTKGFIKVGNSLFGTKRVNAIIRALENPVFSLANVHGGHEALVVTADNGRAVLMPVRASGNAYVVYEAKPIVKYSVDEMFPDDLAPAEYNPEQFDSLDDADAPPEMEAPYYEEENAEDVEVDDPFEERDWSSVSDRKTNAYMYDHPEVKPFFQAEAAVMLEELTNTTKGEKWYNDHLYYESGGEEGFGGTKRHTSDSIAKMLDEWNMSYADIEKGLNAIIKDNGAENIAAAKKVEFMLNERLLDGYKSFVGWEPTMDRFGRVPQNQEYINMLAEQQIVDAYSKESFDALMAEADKYAPHISEEIAPVAMKRESNPTLTEKPKQEAYEAIRPKREKQPKLARATPAEQARAEILTEEPKVEKKKPSAWSMFKNNVLDKGMVFEDLSLATGNRELQARWNSIRYANSKAQRLMEKGNASVSSLKSIRETVEQTGKTKEFYEYLYHLHNADRMTLADRYEDTPNKPVFGDSVTAEMSLEAAKKLERANPSFKLYAKDVYDYMGNLRELLVENGVISRETAKLWAEMYPHYVPIRRVGDTGLNINVPLDTGRTGINAPIKRATGGSRDILPLFDTMGQRTMQTYKAIAKNRFGVELKNTLRTTIADEDMSIDEAVEGVDAHEELLQEGKNGKKPTFTVFEDGKKVTFEITEEMYNAMKPASEGLSYTNKVLNTANNLRRGLLTEYNPAFMLTNPIKDTQDVLINSQHPARTYANYPRAVAELIGRRGHWYQEYMDNGGERNTYFEQDTNTFAKEKSAIRKIVGFPLDKISDINNFIERVPRLAEYIASRKDGQSVDVAMLDAARVTTNFAAGGDLTKFLNRNGATFLNASVQGFVQQVRNVREAKANGLKGALTLAAKLAAAGLPAMLLNHLLWDDDEEYAELSDYVKQNYYIVGKYDDGKFVRIPKGRALAVIQNAFEQMENLITGDDEVDLATFAELAISNLAPNNPLDNNIFAPIAQAWSNRTWYGDDLVPTRLQDLPAAEQYDETTDEISKWLGEKTNLSPYKLNYLLDQYSGGVGDMLLPRLTLEAERGDNSMIAPLADKFTTDGVLKNQNISDFYDTMDKLNTNAKSSKATDEDVLKQKYMNTVNSELSELYAQKREIQNSDLPDAEKYEEVRMIQQQIVDLTRNSLNSYEDVSIEGRYARVGNVQFRWYEPGEDSTGEPGWKKLTDKQSEKQDEVTSGLGIDASEYWSNKEEYDYAYESPEKYAVAKSVGGYEAYRSYTSELYDIKADKDENGDSIRGSRKEKVLDWINNLDADYGTKIILFKNEYNADDTYNYEIIDYLNSREDISSEEMETILKELGFDVDSSGNISW